jgi:hypothetical protein
MMLTKRVSQRREFVLRRPGRCWPGVAALCVGRAASFRGIAYDPEPVSATLGGAVYRRWNDGTWLRRNPRL